jgi:hypothetical protein
MRSSNALHISLGSLIVLGLSTLAPGAAHGVTFNGPRGMTWDVQDTTSGAIMSGTGSAFSNAYTLTVNGTYYNAGGSPGTTIWGGRGVEMAAHAMGSNLTVRRTAWVPSTGTYDYLRYYDTIQNTGSSSASVTVTYGGNITIFGPSVYASSNGDMMVSTADVWYCVRDSYGYSSSSGHVWYDDSCLNPDAMSLSSTSMNTTFSFNVAAGETAAIMVFPVQDSSDPAIQTTCEWLDDLPNDAITDLTADQLGKILNWPAGGAPIIRLVTEVLEVDEGGELALEVHVEDLEGDPFDVYWELTEDGFFDDGTGTTATFSAVGFDGPGTATVSVRAQDSAEERVFSFDIDILNVLPVFVSDPTVDPGLDAFRGRTWEYWLEVEDPANSDGVTRDPVIITVPTKPEGMIYFGDQHFEWTPRADGSDVGRHTVRIEADDRDGEDGAVAVQEFEIEVQDNTPPDAPIIVSPLMETVYSLRPTLTVENALDFDGDPLSYTYEVATTGDFTSIVARGQLFEDVGGQTSWTVNTDLMDGTRYYWRCFANDGRNDGPPSDTWFDIDTSIAPDDGSTDAETDADVPPLPTPGDADCGCRTMQTREAGDAAGPLGALIVLALIVAARRRRGEGD